MSKSRTDIIDSLVARLAEMTAELEALRAGGVDVTSPLPPKERAPPRTWEGMRDRLFEVADRLLYTRDLAFQDGYIAVRAIEDVMFSASLEASPETTNIRLVSSDGEKR